MAKKQVEPKVVVNVETLTVTGSFSVSTKARPEKQGPFGLVIQYESMEQALKEAFNSTRIRVQAPFRTLHEEGKPLGLVPGGTVRADGNGERVVSEAERNALAMARVLEKPEVLRDAPLAQRIQAAELLGLTVPQEWRDQAALLPEDDLDEIGPKMKYDVPTLRKLGTQKLRQLAQDEQIDDYAELPRNELIDALAETEA